MEETRNLPVGIKTVFASATAAAWRVVLMPIDTVKTSFQVSFLPFFFFSFLGKIHFPLHFLIAHSHSFFDRLKDLARGVNYLRNKERVARPSGIITIIYNNIYIVIVIVIVINLVQSKRYHGAMGASAATFAGHYPWFATYNFLDSVIPLPSKDDTLKKLVRNATMGFCSSVVSDSTSNSLRVLKTYRQTSEVKVSYPAAARAVIEKDGLMGLFGRGLKTRLMTNGVQGVTFSVAWKWMDEKIKQKNL